MTSKPTKFFIPRNKAADYETAYESIKAAVKYQLSWNVTDRRIASLTYTSGKRVLTATVGQTGLVEHQYEVAAILEAALFIVVTVTKTGDPGPTILVDPKDVSEVRDFVPPAQKTLPIDETASKSLSQTTLSTS